MLVPKDFQRRLFLAVFVLLVASCSGGGCSSGCSSCGVAPLPGGFPKSGTIPNAASVRVTRSGLDFLQENLGTLAGNALGAGTKGGVATFDIPKTSQSGADICSTSGAPVPPQCQAEIDIGNAKLRIDAITPNRVKLDGVLPVRIRDLPATLIGFIKTYVVAGDKTQAPSQDLCADGLRGAASFPYKEVPIDIELPLVTETRIPRDGYTKLDVDNAVITIGITEDDVEICDDTCGGASICQGALDFVKGFAFDALAGGIKDQVKSALSGAFCTAPSPGVSPPCPNGSQPNDADPTKATKCVYTDDTSKCVPALLGMDGRLDLSTALASVSPGTQGGLDFVLASAGDMNPSPGEATLPAWTPRKPPVPAEDNNANGVSLSMLGGALPVAKTKCVDVVQDNPIPQGIPVPAELLANTITPWPAGTPGPHLGVAIAGRYLSYAMVSAYNSGALCLGVSSDSVDQLQSGYLSLLAPSIKNLTFEQKNAAAAVTTRPGAPPKVTIGGGTDVKTDPLLSIELDRFAADFYVYASDRFVRIFTYTADVTIPVNLQTGKDPKTNPDGGLLPVIGDLKIANAAVTNNELLLFEDAAPISDAVTGLLGSLIGQFLGGGLNPIDVSGALASAGLSLDVPAGGIRKLTSGSDDFIGVFANLAGAPGAAREEADTRAALLERIVDPGAMGLGTAVRARFPKLRVAVEGVASKPTEHTWWVDDGPHAAWSTGPEILVDGDAMLLQGKHVLHVSARVVGQTASEDSTPAEIPFVIDTLAPVIEAERDADDGARAEVRAWDFVSRPEALVERHRQPGDAAWSPWRALAPDGSAALAGLDAARGVDVEVKDEEGNVAQVTLALRGRADSTLAAAGSACSCRMVSGRDGAPSAPPWPIVITAAALGLTLATRRHRRPPPS
jgi:hypothetical protein